MLLVPLVGGVIARAGSLELIYTQVVEKRLLPKQVLRGHVTPAKIQGVAQRAIAAFM